MAVLRLLVLCSLVRTIGCAVVADDAIRAELSDEATLERRLRDRRLAEVDDTQVNTSHERNPVLNSTEADVDGAGRNSTTPTLAPAPEPSEDDGRPLSFFSVQAIEGPSFLTAEGEKDALYVDEVTLFTQGESARDFSCGNDKPATEDVDISVRRLELRLADPEADGGSLLDALGSDDGERVVSLSVNATLSLSGNGSQDVLAVDFEEHVETMEIIAGAGQDLGIVYACQQQGWALVSLRLAVSSGGGSVKDVCLRWRKNCDIGFKSLTISEGFTESSNGKRVGRKVLSNGVLDEEWKKLMTSEGTHDSVTKLSLQSTGLELFGMPRVTSNQKLLKVEIRGPFYSDQDFEVSSEPVTFSVSYTCEYEGFADVEVTLRRPTVRHVLGENMVLTWRKHCGSTAYTHLGIVIKSETFKNTTTVVERGLALVGFRRPCEMFASQENVVVCGKSGELALTIPSGDARSVLEVQVAVEGTAEPPSFQPLPDINFNSRMMQVTLQQPPRLVGTLAKGTNSHYTAHAQIRYTMSVKYVCFHEGVSEVMLTLHVLAHKPIEIAWKKECVEPKVRRGKAFTAPQALLVVVFVIGVIILVVVLACFFTGEKSGPHAYEGVNGHDHDVELERRSRPQSRFQGGYIEPRAEAIGNLEGEVRFH